MRISTLTLILFFTIAAKSQVDTIRWYYQNGNIASVQPFQNGQKAGKSIQYFITGEVKSISSTTPKSKSTFTTVYYQNGKTKAKYILDSFVTTSSKTYYQNGKLNRYYKQLKNGSYLKEGFLNGNLSTLEISKNGQLVNCIAYQQKDSTILEKHCYCGGKQVYWKSDHWEDLVGNVINNKFRYTLKEYDSLGNKTLHIKQHKSKKKTKTYTNNKGTVIKAVDTISVSIIPYQGSVNTLAENIKLPFPEGYPLLRQPNPPRNTTIKTYTLRQLTDSTIHWKIWTRGYDSFGQALSIYGNYGDLKIQSKSAALITYGNAYNDISFQINKTDPNKARVVSQSHYSHYQTENVVDVIWE